MIMQEIAAGVLANLAAFDGQRPDVVPCYCRVLFFIQHVTQYTAMATSH